MPRLMSVMHTEQAVRDRIKTVTRRAGWTSLKVGDQLWLVRKGMGLKKGEKVERIVLVEVVSVRREPLIRITDDDVAREGFPGRDRAWFVEFFCRAMGGDRLQLVTRIEWRYLEETPA